MTQALRCKTLLGSSSAPRQLGNPDADVTLQVSPEI
jgi:hypothetical protein